MSKPERPPVDHVVSMAEAAVAAFLEAMDAERADPKVGERRLRALDLLASADRAFRAQAVYLERVEETADRLGRETSELRLELSNRERQYARMAVDLAEARAWARGYAHQHFGRRVDVDNPPEWLASTLTFDE